MEKESNNINDEKLTLDDYITPEDLGRTKQITISLTTFIKIILFTCMTIFALVLFLMSVAKDVLLNKKIKEKICELNILMMEL